VAPVGSFVLSTFDTDLVPVKGTDLDAAVAVLDAFGHAATSASST
jgi:hypothetical protein